MSNTVRVSWIALLLALVTVPTVVGTVPFGSQFMLSPFSSPAVGMLGLFVGVSAIALALAVFSGKTSLRVHPALVVVATLLVLLTLSTFTSLDPLYSLFGDGEDLNGLAVYAGCAVVTLLVLAYCRNAGTIRTLTSVIIYTGGFVAGIALLQQLFAMDIFSEVPTDQLGQIGWLVHQGASTLGNPDFTGSYLVVPGVLALFRALAPSHGVRDAVAKGATAVLIALALVLTLTRGAWLGLAAGVALWIAMTVVRSGKLPKLRPAALAAVAAVIVVLLLFAGSEIARRVAELFSGGLHGFAGRSLVWGEALDIIAKRPLLGTGPAAFRLGWYGVRELSGLRVGAGAVATDAHSFPLLLAAIGGIPAALSMLGAWGWAMLSSGRMAWRRNAVASNDYLAWWAAMAALAVTMLTAMTTTPLLLMPFVGLGVLLAPLSRDVERPAARFALTATLVLLSVLCLVSGVLQVRAHLSAHRALSVSPGAVREVADSAPYSGYIGLIGARLQSEAAIAGAAGAGPEATGEQLSSIFSPLAERHPNDYELPAWWGIQLFVAGDVTGDSDLLEEGLTVTGEARDIYPNSLVLRTNRARALLDLGRAEEADEELRGFTASDPNYAPAAEVQTRIDQQLQNQPE